MRDNTTHNTTQHSTQHNTEQHTNNTTNRRVHKSCIVARSRLCVVSLRISLFVARFSLPIGNCFVRCGTCVNKGGLRCDGVRWGVAGRRAVRRMVRTTQTDTQTDTHLSATDSKTVRTTQTDTHQSQTFVHVFNVNKKTTTNTTQATTKQTTVAWWFAFYVLKR